MKVVSALEINLSNGETCLGYRNQYGQVIKIQGPKQKSSDLFHALLSAEFEKKEKNPS